MARNNRETGREIPDIDTRQVKTGLQALHKTDAALLQILEQGRAQLTRARQAMEAIIGEEAARTLDELDVEQLNQGRQGIRTSLLKDAGIHTVGQVQKMTLRQLIDLDGIGDQGARKIREMAEEIAKRTRENTYVRLTVDDQTRTGTQLLQSLYILLETKDDRTKAKKLYEGAHEEIARKTVSAKPAAGRLSWFFTGKAKKAAIVRDIEDLWQLLNGPYYRESAELLKNYRAPSIPSNRDVWRDFGKRSAAYYALMEQIGGDRVKKEAANGLPEELSQQVEACPLDTQYLKCTLRRYRTFGVKYILSQQNVLLGDEMGLGKTVQAIAAMASLKAAGKTHFMVVCPASVLVNWCREVPMHSELTAVKIHGNDQEALTKWLDQGGVAVTTYESISRFSLPEEFTFSMLVVDEAHYVKNPEANRTKALAVLRQRTGRTLFMTGTPMENRVDEMCFLIGSLQPEIGKELEHIKYLHTAPQFREKLAPVYLRRTREDVLTELPDLIETEEWSDLSKEESRAYYDAVMSRNFMAMRQVSWQVPDLSGSVKAARLLEICDLAREDDRKVLVFSFFRDTIRKVTSLLGDRCPGAHHRIHFPQERQEIVDEFGKAPGGAVLVSQVQAGGTGLNIQSASVVVFCEPQIKPSIENQAIARAYRMGQVRNVQVHRLLCEDTVDERMIEILRGKQELFDNFADESVVGEESMKISEQAWIDNVIDAEIARLTGNRTASPS